MTHKISINGVVRDMTAEEIENYEEVKAQGLAESENLKKAREDYNALKASAKAKLIAGDPLTEEEANILVGV